MVRKYLELVEGSFTQEHFDKLAIENKPYVAYSVKDKEVIYTIIPKEDGTMYTIYRVVSKDISNCTYNMVDLGLPSGLKWADRNVGATSPEHYGSYFQWGDTDAYTYDGVGEITASKLAEMLNPLLGPELGDEITADNVGAILEMMGITCTDLTSIGMTMPIDKLFNWDNYFDTTDGGNTFIKYNDEVGLTVLESEDDAATVHMGSDYRMPTIDEIDELIENTTHTFIDLQDNEYNKEQAANGYISEGNLKGIRLTATNGNSIFIPAAGVRDEAMLSSVSIGSILWSSSLRSSLYENVSYDARCLFFSCFGNLSSGNNNRYYGLSVRGVQA